MMKVYEREKEDEIESEMQGDDIREVLRLAKYISLCEGKWKNDHRSPSTKSELIEKWGEEGRLCEIREDEWKVLPE